MVPVIRNLMMLSSLLVSAGWTSAQQISPSPPSVQQQGLQSLFTSLGKLYFGTAIETNNFNDTAYMAIATNSSEFGQITPENSQKWEAIQPSLSTFSFAAPDSLLSLATANNQLFRCHTLTWHSQLPPFVQNGTWTRETLAALIVSHISSVVTHYRSRCYAWDVVNEALNDNGTFRNSIFFRTLGTDFIPLSFAAAALADPSARLYYNDFNLETSPRKAAAAINIVKLIQSFNIPIHGIGFQSHFRVGITPTLNHLVALQRNFTALGLETAFSELDIAHLSLPPNSSSLQQQTTDYITVISSCLAVPQCVGITLWQFTDRYSWIPSTFPGLGDACLWDSRLGEKSVLGRVRGFLEERVRNGTGAGGRGGGTVTRVSVTPLPSRTGVMTLPRDVVGTLAPFVTTVAAGATGTGTAGGRTPTGADGGISAAGRREGWGSWGVLGLGVLFGGLLVW